MSPLQRKEVNWVESDQYATTCLLTNPKKRSHSSPILKYLYKLSVNLLESVTKFFIALNGKEHQYIPKRSLTYS